MRGTLAALLAAPLAACATSYLGVPFATYEFGGIELGGIAEGIVTLENKCLLIARDNATQDAPPVILIMPLGTRLSGNRLILPEENGGDTITLGSRAIFQGGYNEIDGTRSRTFNPGGCEGPSFIVNRVYRPD